MLRALAGSAPAPPRVWVTGGRPLEAEVLLRRRTVAQSMVVVQALPRDFPVAVRSIAIRDGAALLVLAGGLGRLGAPRDVPLKLAVTAAILPTPPSRATGARVPRRRRPRRSVSGVNPQVGGEG